MLKDDHVVFINADAVSIKYPYLERNELEQIHRILTVRIAITIQLIKSKIQKEAILLLLLLLLLLDSLLQ